MSLPSCQKRGPRPGDVTGTRCDCGHTNLVHDDGGCVMCALRAIAPAADPQPPTLRENVADHIAAQLPDADLALITYIVDQALPFLADEMTKRPLVDWPMSRDYCCEQRAADVAWLRGESS